MSASGQPSGLRLSLGGVTVLVGPSAARRRVIAALDDDSVRCASGHAVDSGVCRLTPCGRSSLAQRLENMERAGRERPRVVLVDRLTEGLDAADRRAVFAGLRSLAATGPAVLVDDTDPVAALSAADSVLRVGADGSVVTEELTLPVL